MARGVGLQGSRGNWVSVRLIQAREHRDGKWRPAGVEACPYGQEIQDLKRSRVIRYIKSGVAQSQGGGSRGA